MMNSIGLITAYIPELSQPESEVAGKQDFLQEFTL